MFREISGLTLEGGGGEIEKKVVTRNSGSYSLTCLITQINTSQKVATMRKQIHRRIYFGNVFERVLFEDLKRTLLSIFS